VVGRFPIHATRSTLPPTLPHKRRGAPRNTGDRIGSPTPLAQTAKGWAPHPSDAGTELHAWCGLWHAGVPGRLLRVVGVKRAAHCSTKRPGQRTPPPALEAFVTTERAVSAQDIFHAYRARWAGDMASRDTGAVDGLGHEQWRKRPRLLGANTWRLRMAVARTLWGIAPGERSTGVSLCRSRPWDRQKVAPSQLDVVWACREALHEAGLCPIPRFTPDLAKNHEEPAYALPLAA